MSGERHTRRQFCVRGLSLAAAGGALGSLLEGCSAGNSNSLTGPSSFSNLPIVSGTFANNTVTVTIDASSPLANAGSAALVETSAGSLLVARTGASTFAAFSATCTHMACTITLWTGQDFVCPCHGSEYDTSGRVLNGPAPANLPQFNTQFANGILTITA